MVTIATRVCNVVVVDDEPSFLDVARSVLSQYAGVTVVGTATSGEQAIEVALNLRPELVILDVQMPGMSGFEAARRLRREAADVRVVWSVHTKSRSTRRLRGRLGLRRFSRRRRFSLRDSAATYPERPAPAQAGRH